MIELIAEIVDYVCRWGSLLAASMELLALLWISTSFLFPFSVKTMHFHPLSTNDDQQRAANTNYYFPGIQHIWVFKKFSKEIVEQ